LGRAYDLPFKFKKKTKYLWPKGLPYFLTKIFFQKTQVPFFQCKKKRTCLHFFTLKKVLQIFFKKTHKYLFFLKEKKGRLFIFFTKGLQIFLKKASTFVFFLKGKKVYLFIFFTKGLGLFFLWDILFSKGLGLFFFKKKSMYSGRITLLMQTQRKIYFFFIFYFFSFKEKIKDLVFFFLWDILFSKGLGLFFVKKKSMYSGRITLFL